MITHPCCSNFIVTVAKLWLKIWTWMNNCIPENVKECNSISMINFWIRYISKRGPSGTFALPGHHAVTFHNLSHTWVWYPRFLDHGFQCPILTTVVFLVIWLAVPLWANGAHLGIFTLPEEIFLCEINCFWWNKFSQRRTCPVNSLWCQIVPVQESTNEWKNLTI